VRSFIIDIDRACVAFDKIRYHPDDVIENYLEIGIVPEKLRQFAVEGPVIGVFHGISFLLPARTLSGRIFLPMECSLYSNHRIRTS
jgi:hypothetical protein